MPDNQDDYWPTGIGDSNIITPAAMMRAQAVLLGQKTNQQITASVESVGSSPADFNWSFQLRGPALGNYRYELFRVSHSLMLYPAKFDWETHPPKLVENEGEFKVYLREIIGSEQTKRIINALLAQIIR
jgi:hypothetical protein